MFLGRFEQDVGSDCAATLELMLESGPEVFGGSLLGPSTRSTRASVGGEIGVRHRPTSTLLQRAGIQDADCMTIDLEELVADNDQQLPVFTDLIEAVSAAEQLAGAIERWGMPFVHEYGSPDAMITFVDAGRWTTRTEPTPGLLVAALLITTGHPDQARSALAAFRAQVSSGFLGAFDTGAAALINQLD
jgi:hypothetical protein